MVSSTHCPHGQVSGTKASNNSNNNNKNNELQVYPQSNTFRLLLRHPPGPFRPFRPAPPFEFRIIRRSDRPPSRVTRRFIDETRETLAKLHAGAHVDEDRSAPPIRYRD